MSDNGSWRKTDALIITSWCAGWGSRSTEGLLSLQFVPIYGIITTLVSYVELWILKSGQIPHLLFRATPRTQSAVTSGDSHPGRSVLLPSVCAWPLQEKRVKVALLETDSNTPIWKLSIDHRGIRRGQQEFRGGLTEPQEAEPPS